MVSSHRGIRKAVSLAHAPDWRYWALLNTRELLNRALGDPPRERQGLLLEILNLPLPDERASKDRLAPTG